MYNILHHRSKLYLDLVKFKIKLLHFFISCILIFSCLWMMEMGIFIQYKTYNSSYILLYWLESDTDLTNRVRSEVSRNTSVPPRQTVHAVFPHTAYR